MHVSRQDRRRSQLALGLTILGLAAALVFMDARVSRSERAARSRAPAAGVEALTNGTRAAEIRAPRESSRAPVETAAPDTADESAARVRSATEVLVQALAASDFEDSSWSAEVRTQARALDLQALPALQAVLDDDARSEEEQIAASELLRELRGR